MAGLGFKSLYLFNPTVKMSSTDRLGRAWGRDQNPIGLGGGFLLGSLHSHPTPDSRGCPTLEDVEDGGKGCCGC